jgi:hypothetical protein
VLGLRDVPLPSLASLSKKSDHKSARLSLLRRWSIREVSVLRDCVLGILRKGVNGTRKELAADGPPPGLARPACSFCSSSN